MLAAMPHGEGMTTTTSDLIREAAVAAYAHDVPRAHKRGRTNVRPYVPVIMHFDGQRPGDALFAKQEQLLGLAYATRDEALAHAAAVIAARIDGLEAALADPTKRSLREHHGLPRELG